MSEEHIRLLNKHMDKFSPKFQEYLEMHDKRIVNTASEL